MQPSNVVPRGLNLGDPAGVARACAAVVRASWFPPVEIENFLDDGCRPAGDGFTWVVNLLHAPVDDDPTRDGSPK